MLRMLDHAVSLRIDAADKHRHAAVDDADSLAHNLLAVLVRREGDLARGAEEEEAMDAGIEHAVDEALIGRHVDRMVRKIGRHDRRHDTAQSKLFRHCETFLLHCCRTAYQDMSQLETNENVASSNAFTRSCAHLE